LINKEKTIAILFSTILLTGIILSPGCNQNPHPEKSLTSYFENSFQEKGNPLQLVEVQVHSSKPLREGKYVEFDLTVQNTEDFYIQVETPLPEKEKQAQKLKEELQATQLEKRTQLRFPKAPNPPKCLQVNTPKGSITKLEGIAIIRFASGRPFIEIFKINPKDEKKSHEAPLQNQENTLLLDQEGKPIKNSEILADYKQQLDQYIQSLREELTRAEKLPSNGP